MGLAVSVTAPLVGSTSAEVLAAPSSGTAPYTPQWYRALASSFTPGLSNEIAGADTIEYVDEGLVPGTQYYYKVIVTDSAATPAVVTSSALSVLTEMASQSQNQFVQSAYLGMLDLMYNPDTISAQMSDDYAGSPVVAGTAMKASQDAGGVPKYVPCTADTDVVAGFITYNIKDRAFIYPDYFELSMDQNVMFLMSTAAIARNQRVMIDVSTVGGVTPATSGKPVCGFALDVATAGGQLIRVKLMTPSYQLMP